MNLATCALLLCCTIPAQAGQPSHLELGSATLSGWEGDGFAVAKAAGRPALLSSRDGESPGKTGMLHRSFALPPGVSLIRCRAAAVWAHDLMPSDKLDVVLLAAGKRLVPKQVRTPAGWMTVTGLLPAPAEQPLEYRWIVSGHVGQPLRLALVDYDERPGCYLAGGGFQGVTQDEETFGRCMMDLVEKHGLLPVLRYESPHFIAFSNADEEFTELRLRNCELLHALFFDHFRRRGFALQEPAGKLMVAIFDGQPGFEAYLGGKVSPLITGIYHPASNRLVTYDFAQNDAYLKERNRAERLGTQIDSHLDRRRYFETLYRRAREFRTGANIGTIMHEVAHQLSFNCGLMNREGDKPFWLAEGLACYCEPTKDGTWLGIGDPNPERINKLAEAVKKQARLEPLQRLITEDSWATGKESPERTLLGYAQSWVLFRLLMDEQPHKLQAYMKLIVPRRTPDHRLTDFQQIFGADLDSLQRRYGEYVKDLVQRHGRSDG